MVRILAVSDEVGQRPDAEAVRALHPDVVAGCGDVPFDVLGAIAEAAGAPLVFVPGNHDPNLSGYRGTRSGLVLQAGLPVAPPWPPGALNADGRLVDAAGLRFGGLGGSPRYREGPNQYTERQQRRRAWRLTTRARWRRLRDGRRVDVLLTHAPVLGVGDDGNDPVHKGFATFVDLASRLQPELLLHGHVQPEPGAPREARVGATRVLNVFGYLMVETG